VDTFEIRVKFGTFDTHIGLPILKEEENSVPIKLIFYFLRRPKNAISEMNLSINRKKY
jgi:hypothetical protein